MRRIDLAVGGFALAFGIVAFQQSLGYSFYEVTPGPGFLPRVMACAIILLGALILLSRLVGDPHRFGTATEFRWQELRRAGAVAAVITGGVVLIPILGFFTGMLLLVAGLLMGIERMWTIPAVLTTVLIPLSLLWLFGSALGVRLPTGVLGF